MISATEKENPVSKEKLGDALRQITSGWLSKIELAKQAKSQFNEVAEQCTAFFQASVSFMWEPGFRKKFLGTDVSPNFHVTLNKAFELVSIYGPTLYWQNPERLLTPRKHVPIVPDLYGIDPTLQNHLQQQMQQIQGQLQQAQQAAQQAMAPMQQQMQQAQQQGIPPEQVQQMFMAQNPQAQQAQAQVQQLNNQMQQIQQQQQQQQQAQMAFESASQQEQFKNNERSIRASLMQEWLNYTPKEQPAAGLKLLL